MKILQIISNIFRFLRKPSNKKQMLKHLKFKIDGNSELIKKLSKEISKAQLKITEIKNEKNSFIDLNKTQPYLAYLKYKEELSFLDKDNINDNETYLKVRTGKINKSVIRKLFFKKFKNKHGKLFCQLCGNDDLIESFDGSGMTGSKNFKKPQPDNLATIEHIIPRSLGGLVYSDSNFGCTCLKCNSERGLKPLFFLTDKMLTY